MKIKNIKKLYLLIFLSSISFSEVDLQTGVYDAAEEMMAFDNKMNQLIKEHNQVMFDDDEEELEEIKVEDFEEREKSYILEKTISESHNKKVEVKVLNGLLSVIIKSIESDKLIVDGITSHETTMSGSTMSLFIPVDADENQMKYSYRDGILKIVLPKK